MRSSNAFRHRTRPWLGAPGVLAGISGRASPLGDATLPLTLRGDALLPLGDPQFEPAFLGDTLLRTGDEALVPYDEVRGLEFGPDARISLFPTGAHLRLMAFEITLKCCACLASLQAACRHHGVMPQEAGKNKRSASAELVVSKGSNHA